MSEFNQSIYEWFNQNRRDLPWRQTKDPYKIWISEIIFQQTRINQGLDYYIRFIEAFPDIKSLASASEDEIIKKWQGLGYYSRARNLHISAGIIHTKYFDRFPDTYPDILSLKGIGPYTAAAIASIAFNLPYPVLDGNVFRVLSRYFGITLLTNSAEGKKEFYKIACQVMPLDNPGFHNEALMEFGALQCTPRSPGCNICPLSSTCFAFKYKMVNHLPVKEQKTKKRMRYINYYFIESRDSIWIEKRTANDIWKNLYQFPSIETSHDLHLKEIINCIPPFLQNESYHIKSISDSQKHVLTHQIIYARLIYLETEGIFNPGKPYFQIKKSELRYYAIPRLIEKLIENIVK